jgi:hypothetical protein
MNAYLLACVLVGACARVPLGTVEAVQQCAADQPSVASAADSAQVAWRAGRYRLVQVISTLPTGRAPFIWETGTLTLREPTPEQLATSKLRTYGSTARRDLRLLGTWEAQGLPRAEVAEVDGRDLFLGCRYCFDGSPIRLQVRGASGNHICGAWRDPLSSYAVVADPVTQEPLKELAGPFCAARLED